VYDGITPRLNALIFTPKFGDFEPFLALGGGVFRQHIHRTTEGETSNDHPKHEGWGNYKNPDTDGLMNWGPGVMYRLGSLAYLRTDFRFVYTGGEEPMGTLEDPRADRFSAWEWTLGVGFGAGTQPKDTDGDGLNDKVDECIEEPEDFDDFEDQDGCPELDNDDDGIKDLKDKCPLDPEDPDGFQDRDGCPDDDNDEDGVFDVHDDCPNDYGDPENNGCPIYNDTEPTRVEPPPPPDRDGDRVPDERDECPDTPGDPRADPETSNGCPSRVVVTREKIVILDKVFFEYNKATIKHESYSLLDEVAGVMLEHPEITKIEVQGHTDSDGDDAYNMKLSQARAESVRNYLIAAGVEPDRLTAHGYGETVPIDTNGNDTGKANNRRVEFAILARE
jgi:outer membrane protein OmpA-like peptidoglycan-associated protein